MGACVWTRAEWARKRDSMRNAHNKLIFVVLIHCLRFNFSLHKFQPWPRWYCVYLFSVHSIKCLIKLALPKCQIVRFILFGFSYFNLSVYHNRIKQFIYLAISKCTFQLRMVYVWWWYAWRWNENCTHMYQTFCVKGIFCVENNKKLKTDSFEMVKINKPRKNAHTNTHRELHYKHTYKRSGKHKHTNTQTERERKRLRPDRMR